MDECATMTNMAAEAGAFTGLVAADERTVEFLVQERGMDEERALALAEGVRTRHPDAAGSLWEGLDELFTSPSSASGPQGASGGKNTNARADRGHLRSLIPTVAGFSP